ncbi:hypothetical protein C8R43DRAFT_1115958 [Mycena crocata]|nr:hypothetical protein C8R43DRAFT_1115958 [Mycena crocata]
MPSDKEKKKICHCSETCGELISGRSRRRHYRNCDPLKRCPSESPPPKRRPRSPLPSYDSDEPMEYHPAPSVQDQPPPAPSVHTSTPSPTVSDGMDIDENNTSDAPSSGTEESELELDETDEWLKFDEGEERTECVSREEMIRGLEEMLGPDEEAELWDARNNILSEKDRDNIRAFRVKMICTMPHLAFTQMRYAFRHKLEISSHWVMIHRVAILSGIEPQWFHCCVNSCMAYTGDDTDLTHCKICEEARFASDGYLGASSAIYQ